MQLPNLPIKNLTQLVYILFLASRDKQAVALLFGHPCALQFIK